MISLWAPGLQANFSVTSTHFATQFAINLFAVGTVSHFQTACEVRSGSLTSMGNGKVPLLLSNKKQGLFLFVDAEWKVIVCYICQFRDDLDSMSIIVNSTWIYNRSTTLKMINRLYTTRGVLPLWSRQAGEEKWKQLKTVILNLRFDLTGDTTAELCLIELDTSR